MLCFNLIRVIRACLQNLGRSQRCESAMGLLLLLSPCLHGEGGKGGGVKINEENYEKSNMSNSSTTVLFHLIPFLTERLPRIALKSRCLLRTLLRKLLALRKTLEMRRAPKRPVVIQENLEQVAEMWDLENPGQVANTEEKRKMPKR